MKSAELYKKEGFTIDRTAAGRPVAYKGTRFDPDEWHWCLTDLEAELITRMKTMSAYLCGGHYEPRNAEEARIGAELFGLVSKHEV